MKINKKTVAKRVAIAIGTLIVVDTAQAYIRTKAALPYVTPKTYLDATLAYVKQGYVDGSRGVPFDHINYRKMNDFLENYLTDPANR